MPISQPHYLREPRLLKGWKWLIEWEEFVPGTTTKTRVRKTFDLNRAYFVARPSEREARARQILLDLQKKFQADNRVVAEVSLSDTPIDHALDVALRIKCTTDREHTRITYTSFTNIFKEWLREQKWLSIRVGEFDREKATKFLDWVLLERKTKNGQPVNSRTYNNYLINMRSLFYELVGRKYIENNPFANHKPRKEEEKLRHAFTQEDSDLIAQYVFQHNKPVYLAILLISHCGMRLSELRRLRRRDIDLERGMIIMGGDQTKNKERAFITIPTTALDTLKTLGLDTVPASHLVFGEGLKHHAKLPVGRNTISDRFREMLREMKKQGLIGNIEGYTAYSWKDTGAIALVKAGLDILSIQKHLRHKSLATTQRYLQSLGIINRDIRDFKGVIFRLPE